MASQMDIQIQHTYNCHHGGCCKAPIVVVGGWLVVGPLGITRPPVNVSLGMQVWQCYINVTVAVTPRVH